jgi:hypothetical protein
MNTLELNNNSVLNGEVLTKKERVVKMIMNIDDEFLLEEIEDYLSEIATPDNEIEEWNNLSIETQTNIEEAIIQSETGQTLTFEEVKQNINLWLNKSSSQTKPIQI